MEEFLKDFVIHELDIRRLLANDILVECKANEGENSFGGINRAKHWLFNRNCAFVSAWKDEMNGETVTRKEKDSNNKSLQETLREYGYGIMKSRGCYKGGKENSFLVIDTNSEGFELFVDRICKLAQQYEQESVLFKEVGPDKQAFLIYPSSGNLLEREYKGYLKINNITGDNYSIIGSGKLAFEQEKPVRQTI